MRRISINRPKERVRGIRRRLRALDKWADSFSGYFPTEYSRGKYWNCKLPVLDRLVGPPTTTREIQARCARAILKAAEHILAAKPDDHRGAVVTALMTYPQMFGSELCVFFDRSYYKSFFERNTEWQSLTPIHHRSMSTSLGFETPKQFGERGFIHRTTDDWDEEVTTSEEEWWSFYEC